MITSSKIILVHEQYQFINNNTNNITSLITIIDTKVILMHSQPWQNKKIKNALVH